MTPTVKPTPLTEFAIAKRRAANVSMIPTSNQRVLDVVTSELKQITEQFITGALSIQEYTLAIVHQRNSLTMVNLAGLTDPITGIKYPANAGPITL